jgi:hypothetical protein
LQTLLKRLNYIDLKSIEEYRDKNGKNIRFVNRFRVFVNKFCFHFPTIKQTFAIGILDAKKANRIAVLLANLLT